MKSHNLSVGLVNTNKFLADIVKEPLNHLGIPFKEIDQKTSVNFPCVILPVYQEEDFSIASKLCQSKDNIIIFDNEFSIRNFYLALGGFLDYQNIENKLRDPKLNILELELLEKIKECFFRLDLPLIRKWFWPNFADTCFVATHDVDCFDPIRPISSLKGEIGLNWVRFFLISYEKKQEKILPNSYKKREKVKLDQLSIFFQIMENIIKYF